MRQCSCKRQYSSRAGRESRHSLSRRRPIFQNYAYLAVPFPARCALVLVFKRYRLPVALCPEQELIGVLIGERVKASRHGISRS
jgi:hypothetical protein